MPVFRRSWPARWPVRWQLRAGWPAQHGGRRRRTKVCEAVGSRSRCTAQATTRNSPQPASPPLLRARTSCTEDALASALPPSATTRVLAWAEACGVAGRAGGRVRLCYVALAWAAEDGTRGSACKKKQTRSESLKSLQTCNPRVSRSHPWAGCPTGSPLCPALLPPSPPLAPSIDHLWQPLPGRCLPWRRPPGMQRSSQRRRSRRSRRRQARWQRPVARVVRGGGQGERDGGSGERTRCSKGRWSAAAAASSPNSHQHLWGLSDLDPAAAGARTCASW